MTRHGLVNIDARWLADFAAEIEWDHSDETVSRLLAIAGNLQRLDEANQILSNNRTYDQGVRDAEARMRRRSNVLSNPEGEDAKGAAILRQINAAAVTRVPTGARALDDKPHEFNTRFTGKSGFTPAKQAKAKANKADPAVALDLSFLGDL